MSKQTINPKARDFLLKKIPKGGACCEVGVFNGLFSERILEIVQPKVLVLIDPWDEPWRENETHEGQENRFQAVSKKFAHNFEVLIIRETSDKAVTELADNFYDFIYIDGLHTYDQVLKDLANYWPKIKKGGILAGDDYRIWGILQAVEEFSERMGVRFKEKNDQYILVK